MYAIRSYYADEAYLLIDPNVPQSLSFIRNVEKRARKYESAIAIISHSVVDFLDPSIKMYGQSVLDIPNFKILFGTDGQNLHELKLLYKLTDAEEELLLRKKRKIALCLIGAKRLGVQFELPEYRLALMGKGGGRCRITSYNVCYTKLLRYNGCRRNTNAQSSC